MFCCEFCEVSKNTFSYRTSLVAASEMISLICHKLTITVTLRRLAFNKTIWKRYWELYRDKKSRWIWALLSIISIDLDYICFIKQRNFFLGSFFISFFYTLAEINFCDRHQQEVVFIWSYNVKTKGQRNDFNVDIILVSTYFSAGR